MAERISRFSRPAVAAFEFVFRPWMRRRIHQIRMAGVPRDLALDRPLLLAANHVSWWDGFVLREVQRTLRPAAPLYTVMSRTELDRFPFFRRLGVIGVDPSSSASITRALRFLEARVAERPDAVAAFFPQGRIWPSHRRPLGFQRGVELFGRCLDGWVLPTALHVEPLNTPAPTAFVSMGEPLHGSGLDVTELESAVAAELDAVLGFLGQHGEDTPRQWPRTLPRAESIARPW